MKRSKGRLISILTLLCVLVISLVSCLCLLSACSDSDPDGETVSKKEDMLSELATSSHSSYTRMSTMISGRHYDSSTKTLTLTSATDMYIYLDEDTTCNIVLEEGAAVLLCLHGHTLTGAGGASVITVKEGAGTLFIWDCDSDHNGKIIGGTGNTITKDGYSYTAGGAIFIEGNLIEEVDIFGGTITGNSANIGGAIYAEDASVSLFRNGIITDNTASYSGSGLYGGQGGGIYAEDSTVTVYCSDESSEVGGVVSKNTATASGNSQSYSGGGGIYAADSEVSIGAGAKISDNDADGYGGGGGICLVGSSTLNMTGGDISGNASLAGGGVFANESKTVLNITGGTISENDASEYLGGGGILSGGETHLSNVEITGNKGACGGGIYLGSGSMEIGDGAVISGNEAVYTGSYNFTADMGGGIYIRNQSGDISLTILGGEISNNTAATGGGLYAGVDTSYKTSVTLSGSKIDYNTASGDGGGLYLKGNVNFTMNSGSVSYNESTKGNGGGLYLVDYSSYSPLVTINGGDVSHNKAYTSGAGVYLNSSATFTLAGGHIDRNELTAQWYNYPFGAGVYMVSETSFAMSGGSISYNATTCMYGGVFIGSNCTFTMTGGEIVGNRAGEVGGVYFPSNATFSISGKVVIEGNYDTYNCNGQSYTYVTDASDLDDSNCYNPSDLYIYSNGAITLDGALSSGSSIGIAYEQWDNGGNIYTQITATESSTKYYQSSYQYFFFDYAELSKTYAFRADTANKCVSLFDSSSYEVYTISTSGDVTYYSTFSEGFGAAEGNKNVGYTLYLNTDVTSFTSSLSGSYSYIYVYGTIIVDLNGHTVYSVGKGRILDVRAGGDCTILDSKDSYGILSGGTDDDVGTYDNGDGTYTAVYKAYDENRKAYYGTYTAGALTGADIGKSAFGALFVHNGGTLNMYGGIITGNKTARGGGVCVSGNCSADADPAYFYMYGGAISDNYSYYYGGGVDFGNAGYGSICGGIISDNYASTYGGGISLKNASGYSGMLLLGVQENEDIEVGCELVISSNVAAAGNGGGVYVGYRTVYLYSGDIVDNIAYEGDGGGLYVDGNGSYYGTLHLAGGRVMYNSIVVTNGYKYGAGVYNMGRLYVEKDAYVYYNKYYLNYYGGLNYYANIYNESSTKLYIDAGFCGYIGVLDPTMKGGSASQLSTKSSTAYSYDILGCITIDNNYGKCVGIVDDYYIWIYVSHDDSSTEWNTIEWDEDAGRYVYYQRCSQCHEVLNYSDDLSYSNPSGVLTATYNGISVAVEHGFIEYRSGRYHWYATVEDAMEAATDNSIIYLCEDAGDFEISNSHVVWIVLYGHSAGTITVSDGLAVQISYDGYVQAVQLADGASAKLDAGTYGTSILDNDAITISTNVVLVTAEGTYVVTNAETAGKTAVASVTVGTLTVYFESFDDALEYLYSHSAEGLTLTLYGDTDAAIELSGEDDFTIDLNGFELSGSVSVSEGATLTVSGGGEIDAAIIVDSDSSILVKAGSESIEITLEDDSSFEGKLEITSGNVTVDLAGNDVGTLSVGDGEEGTTAAVTVTDASEGNLGTIKNVVTSNMTGDDSLAIEGGEYREDQIEQLYENIDSDDFAVLYDPDGGESGEGAFAVVEASEVSGCEVSLSYTVDGKEITIWFENIGDAIEYAESLEDKNIDVAITLQDDIENCDIEINSNNITIDLGGHEMDGDISIGEDSTLTITGEGSVDAAFDVAESGKLIIAADESGDGISVTLGENSEFAGEIDITSGTVEVDLAGNDIGTLAVGDEEDETSTNVIVTDSSEGNFGTIGNIDASNMGEEDSLAIEGGSYSENQIEQVYENIDTDEYAIIYDSDLNDGEGAYSVVAKDEAEENAAATVTVENSDGTTLTVYFDDVSEAVKYAEKMSQESGTSSTTITLLEDITEEKYPDGMTITDGDVTLDLNGHSVDSLTVGNGETGTTADVTIADSSEDGSGSVSNLTVSSGGSDKLTIEGGNFSQDISDYLDKDGDYTVIRGLDESGQFTYHVVDEDSAEQELASASIEIDEETYYFYSVEAAIKYIEENGIEEATIKLLNDTEMACEATIASSGITIDLNGHTLDANILIVADAYDDSNPATTIPGDGGSLKITDSSNGSGPITGIITVTGESQDSEAVEPDTQQNTYKDTLVFQGVGRSENLEINLDGLISDASDNVDYQFSFTGDGTYGIVVGHEHVYNIEVWTRQADGTYTLSFMCACGIYETYCTVEGDATCECGDLGCDCSDGVCSCEADCSCRAQLIYGSIKPTYTLNEDGTVTVSAESVISFAESDSRSETYTEGKVSYSYTFVPVAYVQTGETEVKIYFESVEDAVAYAGTTDENVTIVLMGDAEEDIDITGSNVTIDLNEHELSGNISIEDSFTLTICGSGDLDAAFEVVASGTLIIEASESGEGINVTLADGSEFSGEMDIDSGNVTVDLNGNDLGTLTVGNAEEDTTAKVTVTDSSSGNSGTIENIVTTNMGDEDTLAFEGGSYSESQIGQIYDNLNNEKYAIQYVPSDTVGEDGSYAVAEKSEAENSAQAYVTVTTSEGETVVYFEDIDDAVSYAEEMSKDGAESVKITLESDVDELTVSNGEIEVDLAGNDIGSLVVGDDTDSTTAIVTVMDSSSDNSGSIGSIEVAQASGQSAENQNALAIEGGSYSADNIEDVSANLADGSALYYNPETDAYEVVDEESITDAKVTLTYTTTDSEGNTQDIEIFFDDISDAVDYAETLSEENIEVTITLQEDIEECEIEISSSNITIDLNSNELNGDISIGDGSTLTITGEGSVDAAFDVEESGKLIIEADESGIEITLGEGSSFEGEMDIASGEVEVDLAGNELGTLAVGDNDGTTSSNVTISDSIGSGSVDNFSVSEDGGDNVAIEGGTFSSDISGYLEENYAAVKGTGENGEETYRVIDLEGVDLGDYAAATVTIGGEPDEETYYFESFEEALAYANQYGGTLTLWQDVEPGDISVSGSFTLDLNGNTLAADISVGVSGNLTITDTSNTDIYECEGSIVGHFECEEGGAITIQAGTYSEDISEYLADDLYLLVGEDTDGNATYSVAADLENALVQIEDEDGNVRYYSSASAAFSDASDGDTIKLLQDIELDEIETLILSANGNITLDLNGQSIEGKFQIGEGSQSLILTVTDSSDDNSGLIEGGFSTGRNSMATLAGGTYSEDPRGDGISVKDGYVVACTSDGKYAVRSEEAASDSCAAYVTVVTTEASEVLDESGNPVTDEDGNPVYVYTTTAETLYFESLSDAVEYAQESSAEDTQVTLTLLKDADRIEISEGEIILDLNGCDVAEISVGDDDTSTSANLIITDSSDGKGTVGSVSVVNPSSQLSENTLVLEGGAYSDLDEVLEYIDDEDFAVVDDGTRYIVVDREDIGSVAAAMVVTDDGTEVYFANLADAVGYAAENNVSVILLSDVEMDETLAISGDAVIDLNGHTLIADIEIDAETGSLIVTDFSEASGRIEGTISVSDLSDPSKDDYSSTLSFEGGVMPNANLEIDLTGLGEDGDGNASFVFSKSEDGTYSIVSRDEHTEHTYEIDVWSRDGAYVTMTLKCSCDEYLTNENGQIIEYAADVTYTENEDEGTYTLTAAVSVDGVTYTYSETFVAVASVTATVGGKRTTAYFDDFESALEYAAANGGYMTLLDDYSCDIAIDEGNLSLDLNGHTLSGDITVGDGDETTSATLTILDTSYNSAGTVTGEMSVASEGIDRIILGGGTYTTDILENDGIETSKDIYIFVSNEGGEAIYTVLDSDTAEDMAEASVTYTDESGEHTVYFEDIENAIEFAQGLNDAESVTITLLEDIEEIEIDEGTIDLDLNGHSVDELVVGDDQSGTSANVAIKDSSADSSGSVGGLSVAEGGNDSVTLEGGTYSENVLDMDGVGISDDKVAVRTSDGEYLVTDEGTARDMAAASVTVDGETLYFEKIEDAIEYAQDASDSGAGDVLVTLWDDATQIDITGGTFDLDLNGRSVETLVVGDEDDDTTANITIKDSSSDNSGYIGSIVDEETDEQNEKSNSVTIEAGTFGENVEDYLATDHVMVRSEGEDEEAVFIVASEDEIGNFAEASVTDQSGDTIYFASIEDAIEYAAEEGLTVTLVSDASLSATISDGVTIDLNGHALNADIDIVVETATVGGVEAQTGGSLTVTDSVGGGQVAGGIRVTDTSFAGAEYDENGNLVTEDWSSALVLEEGVSPNPDLNIDLSGLGTYNLNENIYVFEENSDGTFSISDAVSHEHSYTIEVWTLDGDKVTLRLMCACGEFFEDANGNSEFEASVEFEDDQSGHVTASASVTVDGKTYKYSYEFVASASVKDASENEVFFESLQDAINYAQENCGTVTLLEEADDIIFTTDDVTIDLNGHELSGALTVESGTTTIIDSTGSLTMDCDITVETGAELVIGDKDTVVDISGSMTIEEGAQVSVTGSGEISSSLDADGTLSVSGTGNGLVLNILEDTEMDGTLSLEGDVTLALNGNDLDAAIEMGGGSEITLDGQGGTITLEEDIETSGTTITVTSDTTIDLAGCELSVQDGTDEYGNPIDGGVHVESGTLTIVDGVYGGDIAGDFTVSSGAELTLRDDAISGYGENYTVAFEDDNYLLASGMDSFGNIYYETVTQSEHTLTGCNYDFVTGYAFDPETCTLTVEFTCLCGESWSQDFVIGTESYLAYANESETEVVVDIDAFITVSNQTSGVTYTHEIVLTDYLPMYTEGTGDVDGYEDPYYSYSYSQATCEQTGYHEYTYGSENGVKAVVEIPKTHNATYYEYTYELRGETYTFGYYICDTCKHIIFSTGEYDGDENGVYETDDMLNYGSIDDYFEDMENYVAFEEAKDDLLESVEESVTGHMGSIGSVQQSYDKLIEDLEDAEYEWQTGTSEERSDYMEQALADIEEMVANVQFQIEADVMQGTLTAEIESIFNEMAESGLYSGEALAELEEAYQELLDGVANMSLSLGDDLDEIAERYRQKIYEILYKIRLYSLRATGEEGEVLGEITNESGFDGDTTFVIERTGTFDLGDILSGFTFVWMETGEALNEEEIEDLFGGMSVLAGYSISLTSGDVEISVYSGVYTIRIALPDDILYTGELTIVYVGNDGTVEVYKAAIEDGYIVFETTHFSNYYIIGEKVGDYGSGMTFLGIVLIIELLAAAVLLGVFFAKRGRSMRAKVLWTLLYALVAAAGIGITVSVMALCVSLSAVITLAILCAAMIFADVMLLYFALEEPVEETEGLGQEA